MSFRVKRDRYGNSTRHEFGKFEDVCVRRIFRVGPIEGKDGAPVMIDDSLIINGDIIVSGDLRVSGTATFCDEVKLDTLKAKNDKITINDSLCITGNLTVNGSICDTEVIDATPNGTITNNYTKTFIEGTDFGKVDWATRIAGSGEDQGNGVSLNNNGDIVVTGYYRSNPVTIYNADGSTAVTLANNNNNEDVFVTKYNCEGTLQWATRIAGSIIDIGNGISLNDDGDVAVTGTYISTIVTIYNADGSTGSTLANIGNGSVFIATYNSEGTLQWATRIAGSGADIGNEISLNDNGDIVVTGRYSSNPVTIYNADGSSGETLSNSGSDDAFVVKYNCLGELQWATRIAGSIGDIGNGISLNDNGDIVVTGRYSSSPVTIYNTDGSTGTTLTNSGVDDAFVVKYNSGGTLEWATRIAGVGTESGHKISLNNNGDIVVTGSYSSATLEIYNASGTTGTILINSGDNDAFVVKYNSDGKLKWATRITGSGPELGTGISLNSDIVVTGVYSSTTVTIYNADGTTGTTLANVNGLDTFVAKYNSEGMLQWATRIAGSGNDQGFGISLNNNDEFVVTGYYRSNPVTIYNADGTTGATLVNSGLRDVFIAKYTDNITMLLENGTKTGSEKVIVSDCSQLKINTQIKDIDGKDKTKVFLRDGQSISLWWSEKSNKWLVNDKKGANIV